MLVDSANKCLYLPYRTLALHTTYIYTHLSTSAHAHEFILLNIFLIAHACPQGWALT